MDYNFEHIRGPRQSKSGNFEELVSQLLAAEMNAEAVDGAGGDAGVDCFIKLNGNRFIVFQAKYFLTRLTPSQRRQIKHSLETARQNYQLTRWVLCIPINPTPGERHWFESLSEGDVTLKWWGETKIRTLLAKYPEIAQTFFRDDFLISEFDAFREEIVRTITALKASRWASNVSGDSYSSAASSYLQRVTNIGHFLIQDASLLHFHPDIFIGLDFSELYTYISSDSSLVISTPIVDYCIQNSPQSLFLPPGAIFELARFLRSHPSYENFDRVSKSLYKFVHAFEQDPDSQTARQTYQHAVKQLGAMDFSIPFNLRKLKSILESGKITTTSEVFSDLRTDSDEIIALWKAFRAIRPHKELPNYLDSLNLGFLKALMNKTGGTVRMISSAPSMGKVALRFFGDSSLIRNASEYAYLVYASTRFQEHHSQANFESNVKELINEAKSLGQILKSGDCEEELSKSSAEYLHSLLGAFRSFAPHYRMMLRPVDEMIESGLLALPRIYAQNMRELYFILKSEADLVAGFKHWWDYMCQELIAVKEILVEQYDSDKIIREFEMPLTNN